MGKSEAWLDGWFAHYYGLDCDNPYDDRTQARSHAQWTAGWCARFSAVKHDGDLSLDGSLFSED